MRKLQLELENHEEIKLEFVYSDHNNVEQRCETVVRIMNDKPRTLQIEIQGRIVFHQMSDEDSYKADGN